MRMSLLIVTEGEVAGELLATGCQLGLEPMAADVVRHSSGLRQGKSRLSLSMAALVSLTGWRSSVAPVRSGGCRCFTWVMAPMT
jgi:hypothetical protein